MTEFPEVERLREQAGWWPSWIVVPLSYAERAVRDAVERRTRECVEALREGAPSSFDHAADFLEQTMLGGEHGR